MLSILAMGVGLPEARQLLEEAGQALGLTSAEAKIFRRLFGFDQLPFAPEQPLADMLHTALNDLEAARPDALRRLRVVFHCHTVPAASPLSRGLRTSLRGRLPTQVDCASLTMAHCATGLAALSVVDALLEADERALLLIGEKAFHPRIRLIRDTSIMGEAAVAILLGREPGIFEILGVHVRHDGAACINRGHPGEEIGIGPRYTEFLLDLIRGALCRFNIDVEALALLLPHNVNTASWVPTARALGLPAARVYLRNVARLGHCFGSDPFLNAVDALNDGLLAQGDLVLMVSVGMGTTASCALARVGALARPPLRRCASAHSSLEITAPC